MAAAAKSGLEHSARDTLLLPMNGAFVEHLTSRMHVLAHPNIALFFPSGHPYQVSHPTGGDDDTLAIDFLDRSQVVELTSNDTSAWALLSPAALRARNLLWRRLSQRIAETLEVEDACLRLLAALRSSRHSGLALPSENRLEKAQLALLQSPGDNWSLAALGRIAEVSPFQLTRLFRARFGIPLHQYHLYVRLERALQRLLDTGADITTIALDLGFSSHSHFTLMFRRTFGLTPSAFRQSASSRNAGEARKILIAALSPNR